MSCCRNKQNGCCSGGLRPCPQQLRRDGSDPEGADRIGALPDDLLLHILALLRCARAAAHAGLLARRWRRLWARLPELAFHEACPDALDAALAVATPPRAASPPLLLAVCYGHAPVGSAWMRAAARLAPAELVVRDVVVAREDAVELPCFHRAAAIALEVLGARFVLPPAGGLPALESLVLRNCHVDLLPRCPRLRKLSITDWKQELLKVHSPLQPLCLRS